MDKTTMVFIGAIAFFGLELSSSGADPKLLTGAFIAILASILHEAFSQKKS